MVSMDNLPDQIVWEIFSRITYRFDRDSISLTCCLKISNLEWIECLGRLETLEDLYIKNCRGIGEDDLVKLGPTWRKIKRLQFDANFLFKKVDHWQNSWLPCEGIVELSLMNCIISQRRGLGRLLDKCKNLRKVNFDMCFGPRDSNIIGLAKNSTNLRSISIRVRLLNIPLLMENPPRLTDESLKALAQNCKFLESVTLSFSDPSLSSFSLDGILRLIKTCPLKELSLDHVSCFNNVGMEALCFAEYLETLELARCQEISDEGIRLLARYPRLRVLQLTKCVGVTDYGFRPLIGLRKLEVVVVNDCPLVSRRGIQGTAKFVSFKQDLSLMY